MIFNKGDIVILKKKKNNGFPKGREIGEHMEIKDVTVTFDLAIFGGNGKLAGNTTYSDDNGGEALGSVTYIKHD